MRLGRIKIPDFLTLLEVDQDYPDVDPPSPFGYQPIPQLRISLKESLRILVRIKVDSANPVASRAKEYADIPILPQPLLIPRLPGLAKLQAFLAGNGQEMIYNNRLNTIKY